MVMGLRIKEVTSIQSTTEHNAMVLVDTAGSPDIQNGKGDQFAHCSRRLH